MIHRLSFANNFYYNNKNIITIVITITTNQIKY